MEVEKLIQAAMKEIESLLTTRSVVGEPIKIGDTTVIPLLALGFGFGGGGGTGKIGKEADHSSGGGTGGGGGIRPVAVIISDSKGVRVEGIKGGAATALEALGETVAKAIQSTKKK
jgi:uncharacterized spore protein YtfJ